MASSSSAPSRKTYVLDTSVLLAAPNAIHQFAEHDVVIPLVVITELEAKRTHPELGFPAREALRAIEVINEKSKRDRLGETISNGVTVNDAGGRVRVEMNHIDQAHLPDAIARSGDNDARILAVAFNLAKVDELDVTVVSKDMPMRLKASVLGLEAEPYRNEMVKVDQPYTGLTYAPVSSEVVDAMYEDKSIDIVFAQPDEETVPGGITFDDLEVNSGVVMEGPNSSALARVSADKRLELVRSDISAFGVVGRSAEQRIAMSHLLDPEVGIVSLGGPAGTGKSFLALAAGLEQVVEEERYKRVMVFRPLFAVGGQELGYLPGDADEKMSPWGAAVYDALGSMTGEEAVDSIVFNKQLQVLPLTHLRGRTLNDTYVIIDEAQNLERPVLLTALSRLGENSKVVLSWDAAQRDNMRVGRHDGIAAVVERLKGERLFAHTTLTKSERGPVAELVTRLLDDMV